MGLLNIKDNRNKASVPTPDENGHIIQMIEGEVIDTGSEVTGLDSQKPSTGKKRRRIQTQNKPKVFSYRYKFIHPVTGETIKAYDDLITVEIGEQIYDIGEKVPLIFSDVPNKTTGNNFSVTRKIIFPEIINKKKKLMKIFKILYVIILFTSIFICMCYGLSNQPVTNNADSTESTQIETEIDINNDK